MIIYSMLFVSNNQKSKAVSVEAYVRMFPNFHHAASNILTLNALYFDFLYNIFTALQQVFNPIVVGY